MATKREEGKVHTNVYFDEIDFSKGQWLVLTQEQIKNVRKVT